MPRILLDEGRHLLDRGNDDMCFRVFQLAFQNRGAGVGVCRSLLEAVILFHSLVVQILAVYHKQHLVDIGSCDASRAVLNEVSVLPEPVVCQM